MSKLTHGTTSEAIDHHVGLRIRDRRVLLGLTQQHLAEMIGVTYQQTHKYERGINRVSAGRLFDIANVLTAPIGYFFEGIDDGEQRGAKHRDRMVLQIACNFAGITNERHQDALSQLARALAAKADS